MDYFFAQLEEQRRPMARGKIVIVCVYSGRTPDSGVVSTVNYPGRELGIRSGMPIAFAKKRAPPADTIYLPADHEHYAEMSIRIDAIIRERCDKVVQASIDEWNVEDGESAAKARKLKDEIRKGLGLTCSVGVAPSLIGAKMAASKCKPDGLLIIDDDAERKMIGASEVEKVPGIGPKTASALRAIGVGRVRDLAGVGALRLVEAFGRKSGAWLHDLGQGNFQTGLGDEKEQEEVSRIGTLREKTRDASVLLDKLSILEKEARGRLMNMKKSFKTLGIIFVTEDLKTHTKSRSFRNPKSWNEDISGDSKALVEEFLSENPLEVRRIGIRFGNFLDMGGQTTLF